MRVNFRLFLAAFVLLGMTNKTNAQTFSGGDGSQGKPYLISTPADLVELSTYVNYINPTEGKYFQMTNDIDMIAVSDFNPIGKSNYPSGFSCFMGNFDGGGFVIKNLTMDKDSISDKIALFGIAANATISNLTIDNASFSYTGKYMSVVAPFVGNMGLSSLIMENCVAMNCTLRGEPQSLVCGLVGAIDEGHITNCHVINVNTEGGCVGFAYTGTNRKLEIINSSVTHSSGFGVGFITTMRDSTFISNCYVSNCSFSGEYGVAGFVDEVYGGVIENCYAQSQLSLNKGGVYGAGGFVLRMRNGNNQIMRNCYAACEITCADPNDYSSQCGSFGGSRENYQSGTFFNCYYLTNPQFGSFHTNPPTVGMYGKNQSGLQDAAMVAYPSAEANSLNAGQSSTPWTTDYANPINKGYPILAYQTPTPTATTVKVTDITKTSATLHGSIFDNGETVVSQGFQWREAGTSAWTIDAAAGTNISASLTGLTLNTKYEFRAYITTNVSRYGYIVTFTTEDSTVNNITKTVQGAGFKVYPNPTTNQLKITNYELRENTEYQIYSVVGQVVMEGKAPLSPPEGGKLPSFGGAGGGLIIDVSHLASGMYFLKVDGKVVRFGKE